MCSTHICVWLLSSFLYKKSVPSACNRASVFDRQWILWIQYLSLIISARWKANQSGFKRMEIGEPKHTRRMTVSMNLQAPMLISHFCAFATVSLGSCCEAWQFNKLFQLKSIVNCACRIICMVELFCSSTNCCGILWECFYINSLLSRYFLDNT